MLGELVSFVRGDRRIRGIVYCYMPNGSPEMDEPYVKVKRVYPHLVQNDVKHYDTFTVSLADPTLEILTLDREIGARMEEEYAGKTEDPTSSD